MMVFMIAIKKKNLRARMLRMMAYSMMALKMLKMQVTMYLAVNMLHLVLNLGESNISLLIGERL